MKTLLASAACAALILSFAPAQAGAGPFPYDAGNGNYQAPMVSIGICGSIAIAGGTISTFCAPGFQPAATFFNASGVLTQVSTNNPLPVTGGGGGSSGGSVTQGTSPWVDNVTQFGGVNVSLGSGASDSGTLRVVLGVTEPSLPVTAASLPLPTGATTAATQTSQLAAEQASAAALAGTLATTNFNRVAVTATSVSVSATTSTQVIAANASRKSLQVCGPLTAGGSFEIGYGGAASASSSVAYGPAGISLCNRWGPADGVPTQAIYVYASAAGTFQVEEGN